MAGGDRGMGAPGKELRPEFILKYRSTESIPNDMTKLDELHTFKIEPARPISYGRLSRLCGMGHMIGTVW